MKQGQAILNFLRIPVSFILKMPRKHITRLIDYFILNKIQHEKIFFPGNDIANYRPWRFFAGESSTSSLREQG